MSTDYVIRTYAGSSDRPHDPEVQQQRGNQIRLGGIYGEQRQRYAFATEVPVDLLSAAARRMVEIMKGDFTGGPVRLGEPRMMVRRRRVGIARAAELLGYPAAAAEPWIESYGASVEDAVVREDLPNFGYPAATNPAVLARELNRLAKRAGLVIVMPDDGREVVIDDAADAIDETVQAQRWEHLLKRGRRAA